MGILEAILLAILIIWLIAHFVGESKTLKALSKLHFNLEKKVKDLENRYDKRFGEEDMRNDFETSGMEWMLGKKNK